MFDEPGIGVDELAWIQRDQFVYYVEMAHQLGDPHDWPQLRADLLRAMTAAFGLDVDQPQDNGRAGSALTFRQRAALALLDEIHVRHDPALDWSGFFDALWDGRRQLRADL